MTRRAQRVSRLIRETISEMLQRQVNDPRLSGFITVTDVSISPDLKHAKVFVSVMGSEEIRQRSLEGLAAATGFFRKELGARLTLRHIPELNFYYDSSIDKGTHLLELIKRVTEEEP